MIDTRQPGQADTGEYARVTWSCPVRFNMQLNLFQWLSSRIKFKRTLSMCDVCLCNALMYLMVVCHSVGVGFNWARRETDEACDKLYRHQAVACKYLVPEAVWGTSCARQLCGAMPGYLSWELTANITQLHPAWPGPACTAHWALRLGVKNSLSEPSLARAGTRRSSTTPTVQRQATVHCFTNTTWA